jgi:hypothetical protein
MVGMLRRALAVLALVPLAACSSSTVTKDTAAPSATAGATTAATKAGAIPTASASAAPGSAASSAPAAASTPGTGTSGTTGGGSTGGTAAARGTAPGTYTYDSSGSQTVSGAKQDVHASSTLTMGALANGRQTSTLHNSQGDTTQEVDVRSTGTYLAALAVSSPTLKTAFHFDPAVLLLPDPARVGASWSWNGTSDDGKTTVATTNKVLRTETVTIGGERVATVVLQSHLVITGQDVHYTADATNWVAPAYRLQVRTRTTGSGSYGAFPFSFDVTDVLRSVHPG